MSEMQFQTDDQNEFGRPPASSGGFDLSGMLIKWGVVSSPQQAEYVLMAVGLLCLVGAGYFFWSDGGGDTHGRPTYQDPSNVRIY